MLLKSLCTLRAHRRSRDLTQLDVALALGVGQALIVHEIVPLVPGTHVPLRNGAATRPSL